MINILESINVQTNVPLDNRTVVKTLIERDNLDTTVRFLGMEVYVSDEKKKYTLKNGIENSHWEEMKGVTNLSEMISDDEHQTVTKTEKENWNNKSDSNHNHDNTYSKLEHKHDWNVIENKPVSFPPAEHGTNLINSMTGYVKGTAISAIAPTDTLNAAIGKLEKAIDGKAPTGNYALTNHNHDGVYQPVGSYALTSHNHDSAYQAKGSYAAASHTHDDRYFTESEINTKLGSYMPLSGNSTKSGVLTVTGEIISNGNVTAFSDEKVKKNIVPLDDSVIDKLKQIEFINYELINDPTNKKRVGVRAQDLEKVFPELVYTNGDGIKSVDYTGLNTYYSFAIQQLIKKGLGE